MTEAAPHNGAPPQSTRRRTLEVMAGRIANAVLALAIGAAIARALGPEGRAVYALAATVALGAFSLANLNMENGIFWAIAERRAGARSVLRALRLPLLVANLAGLAAFALGAVVLLRADGLSLSLTAAASVPPLMFAAAFTGLLYTLGDVRTPTLALLCAAVAQLAAVLVVTRVWGLTPLSVLAITAGAQVFALAPLTFAALRAPTGPQVDVSGWSIIRVGLELQPGRFAAWLTQRADLLIVSALVSRRELGLYSLGTTLAEAMLLTTDSLALAALRGQAAGDRQDAARRTGRVATLCASIGVVELAGLAVVGPFAIALVFGSAWSDAYPLALALGFGALATGYGRPFAAVFVREDRRRTLSIITAVAAAVNIALAFTLVPLVGAVGAGIGSSVAAAILAGTTALIARRQMGVPILVGDVLRRRR